ncbi:nucleotide sugar dehydrogenase [Aestuariispira insulae]|uniref:UDP-N-acetyl-D-galactosamine dehydrogenase n=1 Tax=Aestuariispira insulae TaxID=1461337 RepID=A0A3D9HI87_9PROT|nr:nucleotide sugar dehydrogenase [Aestuariispira insulae]RED49207.1 UDP-N-acetyl-D-galactosamine dehydrogenase [Aestuariispira insulae]
MIENPRIAVVGLGYVGLPLAAALSTEFSTIGFDIDEGRVKELKQGHDRTGELSSGALRDAPLSLSATLSEISDADIYIVTVPTPVDENNLPDLNALRKASQSVGTVLQSGNVVVYESTVYPGVTEDFCGPILEEVSGLKAGTDFYLGYSPERINPGDKVHTVDKITKVVAGQTSEVSELLARIYGSMNNGNIFIARNIPTAEASKVIENAQRDINIAFVNEIATIFGKMGISVYDVLDAASTKWNFLNFQPGLVGGHCIGVDPYYLAHAAQEIGLDPKIILSGRETNDNMSKVIAGRINDLLTGPSKLLVLGITFKENVPDIRNSKVGDLIAAFKEQGHDITVFDPLADKEETLDEYGIELSDDLGSGYDCVVGAVPHDVFNEYSLRELLKEGGLVADVKGMWRHRSLPDSLRRWSM